MSVSEQRKAANQAEVVGFLFAVMQGKPTEKEQLKAAELLGKYLGMFEKRERESDEPVEIIGAEQLED